MAQAMITPQTVLSMEPALLPLSEMLPAERRCESRERISSELWMIGHESSTVLRCRCDNASRRGMHLVVPLGYGIAEGQRYELRSHLPGVRPLSGFDFARSRWATVVRTEIIFAMSGDHLGVGISLDRELDG